MVHLFLGTYYEGMGLWNSSSNSFQRVVDLLSYSEVNASNKDESEVLLESAKEDLILMRYMTNESSKNQSPNCTWITRRPPNNASASLPAEVHNPHDNLYLSVIMTFRHDDSVYCRTPRDACVDRMRAALTLLFHLLSKHGLAHEAEVILVEWNPCRSRVTKPCRPRSGGYLSAVDAVRSLVRACAGPVTVRVLEVPEAVHSGVYNPYGYDHFEFHGKNAAARRARGRFLAFTNPDDLWPEALVQRLSMRDLRDDAVYNTDRLDVLADPPQPAAPEALLRFFERHSVRPLPAAAAEAAAAAQAASAHVARGRGASAAGGGFRFAACLAGADEDPAAPADQALHTNGPGDFLLAPRRVYLEARGSPEVPTNTHVDTMTLCALLAHGLGQLVLRPPCSVYHQPHPRNDATKFEVIGGSEMLGIIHAILNSGPLANRRPAVDEDGEELEAVPWEKWNTADWGLAREGLAETILISSC
jgi:hypothetical protein